MAVRLRSYQSADLRRLVEIDRQCFPRGIAYTRRAMEEFLRPRDSHCLVAEEQAEILGFIVTHAGTIQGHIVTLDVLPGHQHKGIGSLLLNKAEEQLVSIGMERIRLETATNNEPAIAFWMKHGYVSYRKVNDYYAPGVDAFLMHKHFGHTKECYPT